MKEAVIDAERRIAAEAARVSKRPCINARDTHVDDLVPIFNLVQQSDLALVLQLTSGRRRPEVLMAFTGLERAEWCAEASIEITGFHRWLRNDFRLPFGAALRLARVVGVDPVLLFAAFM